MGSNLIQIDEVLAGGGEARLHGGELGVKNGAGSKSYAVNGLHLSWDSPHADVAGSSRGPFLSRDVILESESKIASAGPCQTEASPPRSQR